MKLIKIIAKNIKNKPKFMVSIGILFTMIAFSMVVASGCCVGLDCGPGYYGHDNGWHGGGWYVGGGVQGHGGGWHGNSEDQGHGGGH